MRSLPVTLSVLALLLLPAACGGGLPVAASSGGTSAESGGLGVTGGGYRVETGRPTLFYGTLLEGGRRTFTYLVVARGMLPDGWSVEQGWQGTTLATGGELVSQHTLTVDGRSLEAAFHARIDAGAAVDRALDVNGVSVPAQQWLLLYDARRSIAGPRPHAAPRPELPTDLEDLARAVQAYVERLASEDPVVAEFLLE